MHIIHYKSSGLTGNEASAPGSDLLFGEVAVNYRKDNETLFFKNTKGSLVKIMSDTANQNKFFTEDNSNFKTFATNDEFTAAKNRGELSYPCVSYIEETGEYRFEEPKGEFNYRVEASHLDAHRVWDDEICERVKSSGFIPLTMVAEQYSSFVVNGIEMIDMVGPWEEMFGVNCIFTNIIKVPYEEDGVWDIVVKFREGGFALTEDNMLPFIQYQNFLVPITEIIFDNNLKNVLDWSVMTKVPTIGNWASGICSIIKKITYIGDFETTQANILSLIYSGLFFFSSEDAISIIDSPPPTYYIPSGNTSYGTKDDFVEIANNDFEDVANISFWGIINGFNQILAGCNSAYRIEVIEY